MVNNPSVLSVISNAYVLWSYAQGSLYRVVKIVDLNKNTNIHTI